MTFATGMTLCTTASAASIIGANTSRKVLNIKNIGNTTIFLGTNNSVTTSTGFPLLSQQEFVNNDFTGTWYGICTTTASTAEYIEEDL